MIRRCAPILLALACAPACADVALGLHGSSWHSARSTSGYEYRDDTRGLYVRAGVWQIGAYRNSYGNRTEYLAREFALGKFGMVGVAGVAGIATGYTAKPAPVVALVVSAVAWQIRPRLYIVPPGCGKCATAVNFALEFGL